MDPSDQQRLHDASPLLPQPVQSSLSKPIQTQQNDAQLDPNAQNVLAEARKNLQALIDSGISKHLLHQWVEDGPSQQLNYSLQATLAARQSSSPQIPPHPLGPPPPPPSPSPSTIPSQTSLPSTTPTTSPSPASSTPTPTRIPHADIKTEPNSRDTILPSWKPITHTFPSDGQYIPIHDQADASSVFLPPSYPFTHRARMSVSSTSSASSGHASLWSVNSSRSSMSWQSAASNPSRSPLTSATAATVINSAQMTPCSSTKQNIYWCTSCETSFKRKYDWKRHEDEFHERWRKYPCPEPGCNRSFWGSNSFNQHHKQCHGCKTCPHAEKVVKFLRKRKYWACGFCSALHPARERHVEHVARHFESGLGKNDWMHSRVIYGLLHQPLIHAAWDALVVEKQPSVGGSRRPQFSWHPSKTGRAQGFLEKESPGQLQDLLEFFSGDESEAQWIVSVAYELADIITANGNGNNNSATSSPTQLQQGTVPQRQYSHKTSFAQMRPPPSMLPSNNQPSDPSQATFNSSLGSSLFRTSSVFSSEPQFHVPRYSSEASSASPLTMSPPVLVSQADHYDKRELPPPPPPPPAPTSQQACDNVMDFEYLPAPGNFSDWASMTNSILASTPTQQPEQSITQPAGDWNMMHFFEDPRATST